MTKQKFDYSKIPPGFYDEIICGKPTVRKFWHFLKFNRVLESISYEVGKNKKSILDIGCLAGSFLGLVSKQSFNLQYGIDILPEQIKFAQNKYGNCYRFFFEIKSFDSIGIVVTEKIDVITLIEVIEHLDSDEIDQLFKNVSSILNDDGCIIVTTPNYFSVWPVLEIILNKIGGISYEEQHLTRFNYFSAERKLNLLLEKNGLRVKRKMTSHLITPFIAYFSFDLAVFLSEKFSCLRSVNPFGSLIVLSITKIN